MFNKFDIRYVRGEGSAELVRVDDRTTSGASATIKAGEPIKRDNSNFALVVASGDPEIATDILLGLASGESTETSSDEGTVPNVMAQPGSVIQGRATTAANIDTDAELLAIELDYVAFNVVGTVITIDAVEGDDPNVHGLFIIGGDTAKGTLRCGIHGLVTLWGALIGQTMDS